MSCVGPVDEQAGTVSPPYVPGWTSFPLREHLEELTERPVTLASAGAAAAEAERLVGEARATPSFVFLIADATLDSACIIDGTRLSGAHGNAGSLAHITVDVDGLPCWCGARGCLEPYLSSIALEAEMNRPLRRANPSIIERAGIMLGRAIASACATIDVDTVFVTGGVIDAFGDQLLDVARRELLTRTRLPNLAGISVIEPVEHINPLMRAASLVLSTARLPPGNKALVASGSCSPRTPLKPRPTARRSRRSSPRNSRRTGRASVRSKARRSKPS